MQLVSFVKGMEAARFSRSPGATSKGGLAKFTRGEVRDWTNKTLGSKYEAKRGGGNSAFL